MTEITTGSGGFYTNGLSVQDGEGVDGESIYPVDVQAADGAPPQTVAFRVGWEASATDFTAAADGLKADATALGYGISGITTVAGAADSVLLPAAYPGARCTVVNTIATAIQVFGQGTDTISGVATGTGVSQAASKTAIYHCYDTGKWWQMVGA